MDASATNAASFGLPVAIGANFSGSDSGIAGTFPPDSNGAIGPGQFVELVNGSYRVYDDTGAILQQSSLSDFWAEAGLTLQNTFDPRVLYDPDSGRWFAAALNTSGVPPAGGLNPSNFLLAVSNTSDATQGWQAFEFGETFDFTRLAFNQDSVFLTSSDGNPGNDFIVIPKADLLGGTPSVARATEIVDPFPQIAGTLPQVAVAPDTSGSGVTLSVNSDSLHIAFIDPPSTAPTLRSPGPAIVIPEGNEAVQGAVQKGSSTPINVGNQNFSSSVVLQGDKLYGVETVAQTPEQGHPGLRWFEIGSPFTAPVLLDTGLISPPGLDVYYGSIAVNPLGDVVIGFSGSGPNDYPSAYAVAGTLTGDVLQFGAPMLLQAGVAPNDTGRFGDYSATTYDPTNPTDFWTIQEWTPSFNNWSTQISEIVFGAPAPTQQTWFGGTGNFSDAANWTPAGAPDTTDTLVIDAGRVKADDLTIGNPTVRLGSSTETPTLSLKNTTLADTDAIIVQASIPDPSATDQRAQIRAAGTVTDNGRIDVGTTGSDSGKVLPAHLAVTIARDSTIVLGGTGEWIARTNSSIDVRSHGDDAELVNNGTIHAIGGKVTIGAAVSGQGTFDVLDDAGGSQDAAVEFREDVGNGETVRLHSGLLKIDEPMQFCATIEDFNAAGRIELVDTKATSLCYDAGHSGLLKLFDDHRLVAALDIVGNFRTDNFQISYAHGNTFLSVNAPCNDPTTTAPNVRTDWSGRSDEFCVPG